MADDNNNNSGDEILVKCVLLGSTNVGKTSLVHYIIYDEPTDQSTITVGAQHSKLTLKVPIANPKTGQAPEQVFKLSLWDTGGQERFSGTSPIYIRGSQVAIITASTDDEFSIRPELERFLKLLHDHAPDAHYIFALNKCDKLSEKDVLDMVEEVRETLLELLPPESHGQLSVIPCSAYSGVGVHEPGRKYQEYFDQRFMQQQQQAQQQQQQGGDGKNALTATPQQPPQAAIVPQLIEYLIKLASDGSIISRNKKNRSVMVDLNQPTKEKKGGCCNG